MRFRDVLIESVTPDLCLVVSCDSCGGVGNKPGDVLKMSAYFTGRYTARVAILEVMATGADLKIISNAVSNEMHPTAEDVIAGISDELKSAKLSNVALTGSTEENMKTFSTGVGITAIGMGRCSDLMIRKPVSGDIGLLIGVPKMGSDVVLGEDGEIFQYRDLYKIRKDSTVRQLIPIGSKGILYETNQQGSFVPYKNIPFDLNASGGPATSALLIAPESVIQTYRNCLVSPCEPIGVYQ